MEVLQQAVAVGARGMLRSRNVTHRSSPTDIYVADTIGELGLFYRLAHVVFMGGSIVRAWRTKSDRGGQAWRVRSCMARMCGISADIYAALDAARGAEEVENIGHLAMRVAELLQDPAKRKAVGEAEPAHRRAAGRRARPARCRELDPYLLQLRLVHQASDA